MFVSWIVYIYIYIDIYIKVHIDPMPGIPGVANPRIISFKRRGQLLLSIFCLEEYLQVFYILNSSKPIWIYDESHCILDCLCPRSTLFPPNVFVSSEDSTNQCAFLVHGNQVWFCWDPENLLTFQAFLGDSWWTDFRASKLPPRKRLQGKCQNTQSMAFYKTRDIKSIYICTCIYIYIVSYISYVSDFLYSTNIIYFVRVIF